MIDDTTFELGKKKPDDSLISEQRFPHGFMHFPLRVLILTSQSDEMAASKSSGIEQISGCGKQIEYGNNILFQIDITTGFLGSVYLSPYRKARGETTSPLPSVVIRPKRIQEVRCSVCRDFR